MQSAHDMDPGLFSAESDRIRYGKPDALGVEDHGWQIERQPLQHLTGSGLNAVIAGDLLGDP